MRKKSRLSLSKANARAQSVKSYNALSLSLQDHYKHYTISWSKVKRALKIKQAASSQVIKSRVEKMRVERRMRGLHVYSKRARRNATFLSGTSRPSGISFIEQKLLCFNKFLKYQHLFQELMNYQACLYLSECIFHCDSKCTL